ncbi:MAG: hypothetical protein ABSD58_09180 [Verrucomicrobiia bacterium]
MRRRIVNAPSNPTITRPGVDGSGRAEAEREEPLRPKVVDGDSAAIGKDISAGGAGL